MVRSASITRTERGYSGGPSGLIIKAPNTAEPTAEIGGKVVAVGRGVQLRGGEMVSRVMRGRIESA